MNDILVKIGADITDFSRKMKESNDALRNFGKANTDTFGAFQKVGGTLTKGITLPILGATTAAAGLTTALGFKRLVGMDNAQAKLKGLGVEGKQLDKVMTDVKNAVTGTTHTMADGADVAAGALAAGIKEGKELERYITLVGDAATGSNRPMADMAQIFNRVQGSGKLMTMELNQIEHGMPGFSQALAKHLDVAPEKMREMVTDGKVSAGQFLDVMEGFAGGMSDAYAGTWEGMAKNVMSNIGIIGEALIGGLFEDGKKGMAEFLDVLRSDGLKDWAQSTGEKIRSSVTKIITFFNNLKSAYDNLAPSIKEVVKIIAVMLSILVTLSGPLLMLIGFIPKIIAGFAALKTVVVAIGAAFTAISWPIVAVVAAISAVIAVLVLMYNKVEWFREMVDEAWQAIKDAFSVALNFIKDIFTKILSAVVDFGKQQLDKLREFWDENGADIMRIVKKSFEAVRDIIKTIMGIIKGVFEAVWPVITSVVKTAWTLIKGIIDVSINLVLGIIKTVLKILQGDWKGAWQSIKDTAKNIMDSIVNTFKNIDLLQVGKDIINGLIKGIKSMASAVKDGVMSLANKLPGWVKKPLGIKSPSRVFMALGRFTGEGLAIGINNMTGDVAKATANLTDAARPDVRELDLSYATHNGIKATMASAVRGTVDVNSRDDRLIGAIGSLERRLGDLEVVMDGERVGRIVRPHINDQDAVEAMTRRYFD